MLNEQQKKCAEFNGKHLLVLAGAGTGKTKTIVARAEYLINKGLNPGNLAILSFTRKSAQEIAERIKSSIPNNHLSKNLTGRTFHSWCNEIIHTHPNYFPQSKFTLLDEDDRNSAIGLSIGRNFKDSQGKKLNASIVTKIYSYSVNAQTSLTNSIKKIRYQNSDLEGDSLMKMVNKDRDLIIPVIEKYIEYKERRKYLDYDDLLNLVASALQSNEVIRKSVTSQWKHILVDEMQDTNPLQYKLLYSFVDESHLFCVGDDAQSIYGFRGADFKTIHSFTDKFPNSEVKKLTVNYRSTQEILNVSNWLLEQSPLDYNKKLVSHNGEGNHPMVMYSENRWEEANYITDEILKSLEIDDDNLSDTIVIGRSSYSLTAVEGFCLQKKIPFIKLGGTQLMQSAHIRDLASVLRVIVNQYDEIAWIRFLKIWPGIGDVTASKIIEEILESPDQQSLLSILKTNQYLQENPGLPLVVEEGMKHKLNPSKSIESVLKKFRNTLSKKYKDEWEWRERDFEVMIEISKSSRSISDFISEYVLDPNIHMTIKSNNISEDDYVILSTIHSVKGLESKNVHIVDVNPHSYPSTRSIKNGLEDVEEERRCLYVAMTRPKENLTIHKTTVSLRTGSDNEVLMNQNHQSHNDISTDGDNEEQEKISYYFLNDLPREMVSIKVSEGVNIFYDQEGEETEPAVLPKFNYE